LTVSRVWGAVACFMKNISILIITLLLSLISCGRGDRLPAELRSAERLLGSVPDSALVVLDTSGYAGSQDSYIHASYCLLKTYAEYNAYRDYIDESQLQEGVDYFLKHGTRDRKALAYYLRAVVSEVNGSGDEAQRANDLLRACKLVEGSADHRLAALVNLRYASLLDARKWYDASLSYLETGLREAELDESRALQVTALINLSYRSLFLGDESRDYSDAIAYSMRALEVSGDSEQDASRALNSLAACYSRDGQFEKALDCAGRSVRIQEKLLREGKRCEEVRYAVLGDAFRKMEMPDSALFYAGKALVSSDIISKMSGAQLSYIVYRDLLHDNDNAVKYLTVYNALRDRQSDELQNDKVITGREEIEKSDIRTSRSRVICVAAAVVSLLAVLIFLLRRQLSRRRSDLKKRDREIVLSRSRLRQSESERSSLRSALMSRDKLVTSLGERPHYLSDAEFARLESVLDEACGSFTGRMKSEYPEMTAAELRMAVMMRFGFSGKQIAVMLGISPTSVTKSKQRLKARLSLGKDAALDDFIAKY
jgi:tetratricopeptide (TPR) repeat protein